jgi:hypothetical protein
MIFFIPTIPQDQVEDFFKNSIVKFVEHFGYKILFDKRIYSIIFKYKGELIKEVVGQSSPANNEPIFAILEADKVFLTCTRNRGILGGEPMLISKQDINEVIYFDKTEKNVYKYGDWTYKLKYNNHVVDSPVDLPQSLYKYYSNNKDNRDAILNHYLFCSHPYHLNDSIDSTNMLWDYSNINEEKFYDFFNFHSDNGIVHKLIDYDTDKISNFEYIKSAFWEFITDKIGIISLSENPLHTLMWAHYSTEKGFMIELDRFQLIENISKTNPKIDNYVFMPIQYVHVIEKIDFFAKEFTTPDIPLLYSLNIKKIDWEYENEWRLICYSESYGIPNSILGPKPDYIGKVERKFFYSKDIVRSITLGKRFFNGNNISGFKYPDTYI